ncbi:MAG: ATP-binding protein [Anaerolineae bacterium]
MHEEFQSTNEDLGAPNGKSQPHRAGLDQMDDAFPPSMARLLEALHQTDCAILESDSPTRVAEVALRHLHGLVPFQYASAVLFGRNADEWQLLAEHPAGTSMTDRGPLQGSSWLDVLRSGQSLTAPDQSSKEALGLPEAWYKGAEWSLTILPLMAHGDLVGSLNLGFAEDQQLSHVHQEVVRSLASGLAIGMLHARLRRQAKQHAADMEQRVAERTAALKASEARFRTIFESAAIGIALVGMDGRVLTSNPAFIQLLGYSEEELCQSTLMTLASEEDADRMNLLFKDLPHRPQGSAHCESCLVSRDGNRVWADITISVIRRPRLQPSLAVAMVSDISERKQAQQALLQAEKLAVTGRLASSLVHEINNPLQAVIGCLGLAEESLPEGSDGLRYLRVAREQLHRAAHIVSELHDLRPRAQPEEYAQVELGGLLEQVLILTTKRCRDAGVEVHFTRAKDLPSVELAPDRIQQVFLNLVLNAVDAMPDGGNLKVRTSYEDASAGVVASFHDTGHGIPPDVLPRIFDPFTTTKSNSLGLGLFISHNIIAEHGGRLEVSSEPGVGSEFRVWLPACS